MNFIKEEDDIIEINRKPFIFENMDAEDIMARLELMVPDNMYVIHHSLRHKELKEKEAFVTEKWYSKEFTI